MLAKVVKPLIWERPCCLPTSSVQAADTWLATQVTAVPGTAALPDWMPRASGGRCPPRAVRISELPARRTAAARSQATVEPAIAPCTN